MAATLASTREAPYPARPYAWTVVGILIATAVLSYTDRQVLSLLVDPVRGDLGISDTDISLLLGTAFAFIYGIAGIPLGLLADRISRRNLILGGVLVWSAGTIGCGLARSFGAIFAARIVVGLGEAALSPAAISLISDYFPPSRRGTAVALFLSGIAIGGGASILIGGGILHAIESGMLAATPFAAQAPWRLVLLLIGGPGVLWAFVLLLVREPTRRTPDVTAVPGSPHAASPAPASPATPWSRLAPLCVLLAAASFVDNAVGAWAPTLLIRSFQQDPARIGVQLGLLLTVGGGGGVFLGGVLADRVGLHGGLTAKLRACLGVALLLLPVSLLMLAGNLPLVMAGIPLYFALSGSVTAMGFSAILDIVPNRSRGLAMSICFFLNVALGAGLGPTSVALTGERFFGAAAGLGPPLVANVIGGYLLAIAAIGFALKRARTR